MKPTKKAKFDNNKSTKAPMFSGEQLNFLIQNAHHVAQKGKKNKKVKKRKVQFKRDSSSEDESTEEHHAITKLSELDSDDLTTCSKDTVESYYFTNLARKIQKKKKLGHVVGDQATAQRRYKAVQNGTN